MKKKDMKSLAQKIAKAEKVLSASTDEDEIRLAKEHIMYYSNQITAFEDMLEIDNMIREILNKNS